MSCTTLPYPGLLHLLPPFPFVCRSGTVPVRRARIPNDKQYGTDEYVYIIGCISHHTEKDNIRIWHLIRIIYRKYFDANVRLDAASHTLLVRFSQGKSFPFRLALPISRSLSRQLAAAEPRAATATSFLHPSRPHHLLPHFAQRASAASSPSKRRRDASPLRAAAAAPTNINGG
jgi:hypothetical protein